jgi:hypothetical protein
LTKITDVFDEQLEELNVFYTGSGFEIEGWDSNDFSISVFNITGQACVVNRTVISNRVTCELNSGVYFVVLQSGERRGVVKKVFVH